ncbi:MAG: Smr/MutS family protein [Acidobacteriota bacterium]
MPQDPEKLHDLDESDAVVLPIEDFLDLHSFRPQEILEVVEEYLYQCQRQGFREVRLIHGKGQGVQRRMVQSFLGKSPAVHRFRDATPEAGGWGATIVQLKVPEDSHSSP